MRYSFFTILFLIACFFGAAQEDSKPDFIWGNVSYFNLNRTESIFYNSAEIKLLALKNQFNTIKIGQDTISIKVSKRTLAIPGSGIRLFVADNKHV